MESDEKELRVEVARARLKASFYSSPSGMFSLRVFDYDGKVLSKNIEETIEILTSILEADRLIKEAEG